MTEKASAHRFRVLDGWRGICALGVALFHLQINSHIAAWALVRNAWLFVDFFFVLSGFVIAYAYGERLASASQVKTFVRRRFARLWPLQAVLLAAFVVLELYRFAVTGTGFIGPRSVFAIFTNLALIQSLGIHHSLTWNTPAWSISTEFATYLVFAIVCALGGAAHRRIVLCIVLAAAGAVTLLLFSRTGMRETFGWGFFRCLYGFFVGTLTYEIWKRGWFAQYAGTATEIGILVAAAVYLIMAPGSHAADYFAPPLFAVVIWVFAQQRGVISAAMAHPAVDALGRWSYSIYMVHMLVIALLFSAADMAGGWTRLLPDGTETILMSNRFSADALTLAYLAVVVALASLTWRFIEVPGQRLFKSATRGNAPIAPGHIPL